MSAFGLFVLVLLAVLSLPAEARGRGVSLSRSSSREKPRSSRSLSRPRSSSPSRKALGACKAHTPTYDYYLLELQWGITECMDGAFSCPTHVTLADFTLHGLWPENNDGSWPCNCPGPAFNETALEPIAEDLNKFWPSLSGPSPTFWAHEWTTHGTCSTVDFADQFAFFNGTLALRSSYSIVDALATAGIAPSNTKSFTLAAFNSALKAAYGHTALISCDSKGNVETAVLCVSKAPLALVDCPANVPRSCSDPIYLPASY